MHDFQTILSFLIIIGLAGFAIYTFREYFRHRQKIHLYAGILDVLFLLYNLCNFLSVASYNSSSLPSVHSGINFPVLKIDKLLPILILIGLIWFSFSCFKEYTKRKQTLMLLAGILGVIVIVSNFL